MVMGLIVTICGCSVHIVKQQPFVLQEPPGEFHFDAWEALAHNNLNWIDFKEDTFLCLCIEKMLATNPSLAQRRAVREQLEAQYKISLSVFSPSVSMNFSAGTMRRPEDERRTNYHIAIPAAYELDIWKKRSLGKDIIEKRLAAVDERNQAITLGLIAEMMERYYQGLFLKKKTTIIKNLIYINKHKRMLAIEQFQNGLTAKRVVLKHSEAIKDLDAEYLYICGELAKIEHSLNVMMSETPKEGWLPGEFYLPGDLCDL
ncbi:MAG: TolC family protein, partial [Nanoarchaeota archaeon]|nr:TolC family protein [Nanoarchaeota archaeon]